MAEFVLAIDQGTTGTTAMVVDQRGRIRARAYKEIRQFYPREGWVEHDPEEIYRSVIGVGKKALASARVAAADLAAVGITNQRETFVVWERASGRPIHRAIVWQCRRSAEICAQLREREDEIARRTGLVVDPYFSGTKLKWLLDRDATLRPRARSGQLCFGTIETWIVFRLSRGAAFITDFTNASRTMMFNLDRLDWDDEMLAMLDVPREMLPAPVASRGPFAEAARSALGARAVPIGACIGDQQSALFGHGGVNPGDAKVTYGTGAFLLAHTGANRIQSRSRLLTTLGLGAEGESAFALEGSVFIAGAVIQWLRDEMGVLRSAAESNALARRSKSRDQPYLVPAFVGLGAPYWDADARGAIVGITRGTSRADLVRAALDSIAYQVRDVVLAMETDIGAPLGELKVDGGASFNDYLMQFQADLLDRPVRRLKLVEATALGAAMLAGIATGVWKTLDETASIRAASKRFIPRMKAGERERLVAGWREAVERVLSPKPSG